MFVYINTTVAGFSQVVEFVVVPNRAATAAARVKPEVATVVSIVTLGQPEIIDLTE